MSPRATLIASGQMATGSGWDTNLRYFSAARMRCSELFGMRRRPQSSSSDRPRGASPIAVRMRSARSTLVTGDSSLSGTINLGGILLPVAQLVAGVVAVAFTIALHLLLTRTNIGSRLLAVSEDRSAAMLMGIRPDRMQALAWGLAGCAAGIAGALMATAYPWSPSVGETFGLIAFVVVAFGGFGSVPGALYAGLIIGLIQAVSAFWFGPIYKDIIVYSLFVALLWLRPQGLMGKA